MNVHVERQETLLSSIKRRKLTWFGHVFRQDMLPKTILWKMVECDRRRGRPRKSCKDNIIDREMDVPVTVVVAVRH